MNEASQPQPLASQASAMRISSLADPFNETATPSFADILPEHVATRRWYRAKTRTIERIDIVDIFALPGTQSHLLILETFYVDGDSDRYILPVSVALDTAGEREEIIVRFASDSGEAGMFYSALGDSAFRDTLLNLIVCETTLTGRSGTLVAARTTALHDKCEAGAEPPKQDSFVSRAEQSNTSIIYRDRYILKLFRKLEEGVNPDVEIGRFLTERGFKNTPSVLGTLEYRAGKGNATYGAGILQQFVPNRGDAWKYTLDSLEGFFQSALASEELPPPRPSEHPLDIMNQPIPAAVRSAIGPYLDSAALLGRRTAEMHAALSEGKGNVDFEPEPFSRSDTAKLHQDLLGQADIAFGLLRRKQAVLTGSVADRARELLHAEHRVSDRFAAIKDHPIATVRIRHHGDYHLGQVLYTGEDFMIIDFEGEPARPLAERRAKTIALRDVAGMVRSFQYAAFAALFGQVPGVPAEGESLGKVEAWAAAWYAYVSAAYLKAYFEQAQGHAFVPAADDERRILLDAFLLQKALYEVAYELNNRPDWVQIPLRGILGLVSSI